MEYILHIAFMLNIYIMLVLSTNVTVMANLLTLCQAAFYGIGAYIGTLFLMQFELPIIIIALCVMGLSGLCSIIITLASVKLKGDYFILATLGFQMVVYTILYNWIDVTNGPFGISGIPALKLLGIWELQGVYAYFAVSLIAVLLMVALFAGLKLSPYGRALRSLRSDEQSLQALGRDVSFLKGSAFFISAAFAGLAGMLYASYASYIDPTSFTLLESLFIVSALFIGGTDDKHLVSKSHLITRNQFSSAAKICFPIHLHLSGRDHFIRLPAAGNSGARDIFIDSHVLSLRFSMITRRVRAAMHIHTAEPVQVHTSPSASATLIITAHSIRLRKIRQP